MKTSLILILTIVAFGCTTNQKQVSSNEQTDYYTEKYRPQYHFTPDSMWMNDPNGMVYYEGEYHLFYQYYPDSNVWGPMHWGHAISTDLIHWEHLPIALYPDSLGWIFSGSAVFDKHNTSGLGTENNPPLVAVYTYHSSELEKTGSNKFQSQGIAYSTDKGRIWQKFKGNPVLENPGIRDFRDPKVIWHEKTKKWIMVLAVQNRVHLYSSSNLKEWEFESEFGENAGAHGGVWECPDLIKMKIKDNNESKWIMLVSINPGAPNGGSGTQYFVGEFDGRQFINESTEEVWLDWGRDNYAGVTWSNVQESDGRHIFIGWMSNWSYATVVPTWKWRSAMTLPRELILKRDNGHYVLASIPIKELDSIRDEESVAVIGPNLISGETKIETGKIKLNQSELVFNISITENVPDEFGFEFENSKGETYRIGYSVVEKQFYADRTESGNHSFSENFSGIAKAPYEAGNTMKLQIFVDASSVEIFVDGGNLVITELVFPSEDFTTLKLFSLNGTIEMTRGELKNINRIW